jgi:hypothetical protein
MFREQRICQYMTLLHLAPAIQEYLLLLAVSQASPIYGGRPATNRARARDGIASVPFLNPCWCGK